ncbi:hypothetical protein [Rhodoblastus sp.]|uniref:hypothetical protein n=1 Tax=Rhodoblastus sp. TaxID=1962975 RepID=UPI0025E5B913|nr:hypothetical protein [Rhodoblastus sp.]
MDQEEGMRILTGRGWLSATSVDFQRAILSFCRRDRLEAGAPIQEGGEEIGELLGLASGVAEMRKILGPADTPIMHFAHPVFWFGYVPIIFGKPRRITGAAKTTVWTSISIIRSAAKPMKSGGRRRDQLDADWKVLRSGKFWPISCMRAGIRSPTMPSGASTIG